VHSKEFNKIFVEMERLSETISASGRLSRRYRIFDKYIDLCKLINKSYHVMGGMCCLVIIAYPGIMYLFTKELVFSFSCYIPLLDSYSGTGYTVTMLFHLLCLFIAYNGTIGFDTIFILGVVQYAIEVDIFQVHIAELNEFLLSHEGKDQTSEYLDEIERRLNSIINAHQSINSCVSRMRLILYWPTAVQVSLSIVSLAISLYMAIKVLVTFKCLYCNDE
jgi:7tm Odorant receptor